METAEIRPHDGKWLGESWVFHLRTPKARKQHTCHRCGQIIVIGTKYVKFVTANLEGWGMETWTLHGECYLDKRGVMFDGIRPSWRWVG